MKKTRASTTTLARSSPSAAPACSSGSDVWERLGGFDRQLRMFRDDVDLGWRANLAGYRVAVAPEAVVYHVQAAAQGRRTIDAATRRRHLLDRRNALFVLLGQPAGRVAVARLPTAGACLDRPGGRLRAGQAPGTRRRRARRRAARGRPPGPDLARAAALAARSGSLRTREVAASARAARGAGRRAPLTRSPVCSRGGRRRAPTSPPAVTGRSSPVRATTTPSPTSRLGFPLAAAPAQTRRGAVHRARGDHAWSPLATCSASAACSAARCCRCRTARATSGRPTSRPGTTWGSAATSPHRRTSPWWPPSGRCCSARHRSRSRSSCSPSVPLAGFTALLAARRLLESPWVRVWAAATYALLPATTGAIAGGRLGTAVATSCSRCSASASLGSSGTASAPGSWVECVGERAVPCRDEPRSSRSRT